MCLFKEFKRNFTKLMNHEKKLTEGSDRVKIAAVSEKKNSQGRQVKEKSVEVCIWLNNLLQGVMKVVKGNLHLKKNIR